MTEFRLERGAVLPKHKHPHEQTGYLVAGRMDLVIGSETHVVSAGDSWCMPRGRGARRRGPRGLRCYRSVLPGSGGLYALGTMDRRESR
jgi:hypothetical protein